MAENIEHLVEDFLICVRARGLSPMTLREYRFPFNEVLAAPLPPPWHRQARAARPGRDPIWIASCVIDSMPPRNH